MLYYLLNSYSKIAKGAHCMFKAIQLYVSCIAAGTFKNCLKLKRQKEFATVINELKNNRNKNKVFKFGRM